MLNLPTINSRDTAFTRELKTAINELDRKINRQRLRGDGATFSVSGSGGGLVGHATTAGVDIPAKITGAPTNGQYPIALYANGKNAAQTGSGLVEVLNLAVAETLPVDTWITVNTVRVITTGDVA